jgi:hypothetical protein
MQFAQPYPGATAVLVDKFDAGQLQRAPNRQVVSSRHRRLAVGQLGAATGRIGHRHSPAERSLFSIIDQKEEFGFVLPK